LLFNLTAVASPSGYRNITVAIVGSSGSNPFTNADGILLTFTRVGDQGTAGPSEIPSGGSAGTPALSVNGDSNTGIWAPGADILAVSTGGTERVRWSSAGIGVGDNAAAGTSAANVIAIKNSTAPTTNPANTVQLYEDSGELSVVDANGIQANITTLSKTPTGLKNIIVNGNFRVWQRGTSFTSPANAAFQADRWKTFFSTSGGIGTYTISRQAFTPGQTDVPGEPDSYLRFDKTVAGTSVTFHSIYQPIENVRTFAGQRATLSFYAKANAARNTAATFWQSFGTGGSSLAQALNFNYSLTTSWQRFSVSFDLASISGKTVGTNHFLYLELYTEGSAWGTNNTTYTIDFANVQVELGSVPTPFDTVPFAYELRRCQRYFWKTFPYATAPAQNVSSASGAITAQIREAGGLVCQQARFPDQMRASPTITTFNPFNADANWRNIGNNTNLAPDVFGTSEDGFAVRNTTDAGSAGHLMAIHATAEAEL